jgi:hypothetical protein
MYVAVALVFILINYGLSKLAEYVQRRRARLGIQPPSPQSQIWLRRKREAGTLAGPD